MAPVHILVVDDEPAIQQMLVYQLGGEGYRVSTAASGEAALEQLAIAEPQLVTVDLRLPEMGGEELCRAIRARSAVPIVVISGLNSEADKARALDAGADDFIVKPIPQVEFFARLRAVLRRTAGANGASPPAPLSTRLSIDDLTIDTARRRLVRDGKVVHLQPREWAVLEALFQADGALCTYEQLIAAGGGRGRAARVPATAEQAVVSSITQLMTLGVGEAGHLRA